jgi:hypothetical protein
MRRIAAVLRATRNSITALGAHYTAMVAFARPPASVTPPSYPPRHLPYPLRDTARFADVEQAAEGKLIYFATVTDNATTAAGGTGRRVCVKFTAGPYCADAHRAWAEAGVAPALISCEALEAPAGYTPGYTPFKMITMEFLDPREWRTLDELDEHERAEVQGVVMDALKIAHGASHPVVSGGESAATVAVAGAFNIGRYAHGDLRDANTLVRLNHAGSAADRVRFVDFEWAGVEGTARYPLLMSSKVAWPAGARPGALVLQAHDAELLGRSLAGNTYKQNV